MNIKNKTCIFLIILSVLTLTGCCKHYTDSNFTETAINQHSALFTSVGITGEVTVLDRNGKRIRPCNQQGTDYPHKSSNSSANTCKTRIEERDGRTVVIKDGKEIDPIFDTSVRTIGFKGSHCETVIDSNGNQTEDCY